MAELGSWVDSAVTWTSGAAGAVTGFGGAAAAGATGGVVAGAATTALAAVSARWRRRAAVAEAGRWWLTEAIGWLRWLTTTGVETARLTEAVAARETKRALPQ